MNEYFSYENGTVLSKEKISNVADGFIELIKKELPEEALSVVVLDSVLENIKTIIHSRKICL